MIHLSKDSVKSSRDALTFHVYTIWLFTRSDLKTILVPSVFFAVSVAASECKQDTGGILHGTPTNCWTLRRLIAAAIWTWINLLAFSINNQRSPESVSEDRLNKPWRPFPAKRIAPEDAFSLMLGCYVTALLVSSWVGGVSQCVSLIALGYWYNNAKGSDSHFIIRNSINGLGYMCFASGTLEILLGTSMLALPGHIVLWISMIGAVIFTTIHAQDMADQAGDRLRNRKTVPLVLGDTTARYLIVAFVGLWSVICPVYWNVGVHGYILTLSFGAVICSRFLSKRTVLADKISFLIYNIWILALFSLPLLSSFHESRMLCCGLEQALKTPGVRQWMATVQKGLSAFE